MSTTTVPVTLTAADQNGNAVAGARIKATLDATEVYQGFVVPETVETFADAAGRAVLQLWPNALRYYVLYRAWSKDAEYGGNAQLASANLALFKAELGEQLESAATVSPKS